MATRLQLAINRYPGGIVRSLQETMEDPLYPRFNRCSQHGELCRQHRAGSNGSEQATR
jgi:hypothetical protein